MALTLWLGGCCFAVREEVDRQICDLAGQPLDQSVPIAASPESAPNPPSLRPAPSDSSSIRTHSASSSTIAETYPIIRTALQPPVGADQAKPTQRPANILDRLKIPPAIPGSNAPAFVFPPRSASREEKEAAINRYFPPTAPLGPEVTPLPGPNGKPLTPSDLQALGMAYSPLLRQSASDVQAARGAAIQAGAYPNPNFGYQSDTVGTGGTAGFQGVFFEQTIKTGGKLTLAQAAATMDLQNAEVALRRARFDLVTAIRSAYFAVLVAQENVKVSHALTEFTDAVYRVNVDFLKAGEILPPYQAMQLRVLSVTARDALVQARNRYTAAWKALATTLGLPAMPPTEIAGRADMPLPTFRYDQALAHVLVSHTDVLTAANTLQKSRYNLRLAQMGPVPDVSFHVAVEKDFSMPPFLTTYSVQMGIPVPVWDQNKGNIIQAQGALLRATEQFHQVRDDLTNRLATAFEQYDNGRLLLEDYRNHILPDQVRAYRLILERHINDPANVAFLDVLTAQQTLASVVTTYLTTLATAWSSVASVADLLQTPDLYQFGKGETLAPIPELDQTAPLPCSHPCGTATDPAWRGANGTWPPAMVGEAKPSELPSKAPQPAPAEKGAQQPTASTNLIRAAWAEPTSPYPTIETIPSAVSNHTSSLRDRPSGSPLPRVPTAKIDILIPLP